MPRSNLQLNRGLESAENVPWSNTVLSDKAEGRITGGLSHLSSRLWCGRAHHRSNLQHGRDPVNARVRGVSLDASDVWICYCVTGSPFWSWGKGPSAISRSGRDLVRTVLRGEGSLNLLFDILVTGQRDRYEIVLMSRRRDSKVVGSQWMLVRTEHSRSLMMGEIWIWMWGSGRKRGKVLQLFNVQLLGQACQCRCDSRPVTVSAEENNC
jgi:hypothetical protein